MAEKSFIDDCHIKDTDMTGCLFSNSKIYKTKFNNSVLTNTQFENSKIESCAFNKINLFGVSFRGARLVNIIFDNTDLSYSNFEEAVLENVDFKKSYQHGSNIIKSKSIQSCLGIQEQLQNKDFNKWELD